MIQQMTERHVAEACQIHIEALSDSFLPMLGRDFLRVLYTGILEYNLGFGFVYMVDDKVVGFVLASKDTGKLFKEVIKRKWLILLLTVPRKVIKSPSILIRMYETFSYPKENPKDSCAELLVIAIDKDYRGKKIGKELINSLNTRFLRENIYKYKVSVYSDNKNANEFYKAAGFKFDHSFPLYKRECNVYEYDPSTS